MYKLSIKQIEDNGNEKELVEGDGQYLTSIAVIGEVDDDRCVEILVNTSMKNLSQMIAAGKKFRMAAKIAAMFLQLVDVGRETSMTELEDALSESLEGGLQ